MSFRLTHILCSKEKKSKIEYIYNLHIDWIVQSRIYWKKRSLVSAKGKRARCDTLTTLAGSSRRQVIHLFRPKNNTEKNDAAGNKKRVAPNRKTSRQTQTDPRKTICVITHSEQAHHPQQENKRRAIPERSCANKWREKKTARFRHVDFIGGHFYIEWVQCLLFARVDSWEHNAPNDGQFSHKLCTGL